jgi:hypothetical protein
MALAAGRPIYPFDLLFGSQRVYTLGVRAGKAETAVAFESFIVLHDVESIRDGFPPKMQKTGNRFPGHRFELHDVVSIYCQADELVDFDSYLRGPVIQFLDLKNSIDSLVIRGAIAAEALSVVLSPDDVLYVVQPWLFRPFDEEWRRYDGVPFICARQRAGIAFFGPERVELEAVCNYEG